ncbi:MAG: HIG1 domain-containing protein [Blastomonas sp.]
MNYVLVPALIILMGLVLFALVRGLVAFLQMTEEDLKNPGVGRSHEMQNKMMFARVKYQALAVIVLALLLMFSR